MQFKVIIPTIVISTKCHFWFFYDEINNLTNIINTANTNDFFAIKFSIFFCKNSQNTFISIFCPRIFEFIHYIPVLSPKTKIKIDVSFFYRLFQALNAKHPFWSLFNSKSQIEIILGETITFNKEINFWNAIPIFIA